MPDLAAKITRLSRWIDESYPADVQGTETHMRRRIDKLMEEVGEVGQALGGMWGENPRKGFTHGVEDVKAELLDVAITALGAWVHCDDEMDVMGALDAKLDRILERVGLSVDGAGCPSGCGCVKESDPDARECACDGPCTMDPNWPGSEA